MKGGANQRKETSALPSIIAIELKSFWTTSAEHKANIKYIPEFNPFCSDSIHLIEEGKASQSW